MERIITLSERELRMLEAWASNRPFEGEEEMAAEAEAAQQAIQTLWENENL